MDSDFEFIKWSQFVLIPKLLYPYTLQKLFKAGGGANTLLIHNKWKLERAWDVNLFQILKCKVFVFSSDLGGFPQ